MKTIMKDAAKNTIKNTKNNSHKILFIPIILLSAYFFFGIIYTAVLFLLSHSDKRLSDVSLEHFTNNQGVTFLDKDGSPYGTLQLKTQITWIPYKELPELFSDPLPESAGFKESVTAYFEFQSGHYKEQTCTGMLIQEAQKNGILENISPKTNTFQKQLLSRQLGRKYSKEELLETLFNTMNFGNGIYGLEAASIAYETSHFSDLSEEAQNDLYKITENIIKQGQYPDYERVNQQTAYYSEHTFCDGVIKQLIADLNKHGYTTEEAARRLYFEGGSVKTTLNSSLQKTLDNKYAKSDTFTDSASENYIQSAMVILDYQGKVRAAAGGNAGNTLFNRALSVPRQIGSTIKPFAIYAPAIDRGLINYSTIIEDFPIQINSEGQITDWPKNYDGIYEENVTIAKALQTSKNTVAVRVGKLLGEMEIYNFFKDSLFFDNLNIELDAQLSALALGYLSEGITLDKLASCYTIFGNNGIYTENSLYEELLAADNTVQLKKEPQSRQAVSPASAAVMNRLLKANVEEPGALAGEAAIEGVEVLGKTGTVGINDEVKCQYFAGLTSEYIGCVWIGFDGEETLNQQNYKHAASIWKSVMKEVSQNVEDFQLSNEIEQKEYCLKTGLSATEYCEKTAAGWYEKGKTPDKCQKCKETVKNSKE